MSRIHIHVENTWKDMLYLTNLFLICSIEKKARKKKKKIYCTYCWRWGWWTNSMCVICENIHAYRIICKVEQQYSPSIDYQSSFIPPPPTHLSDLFCHVSIYRCNILWEHSSVSFIHNKMKIAEKNVYVRKILRNRDIDVCEGVVDGR